MKPREQTAPPQPIVAPQGAIPELFQIRNPQDLGRRIAEFRELSSVMNPILQTALRQTESHSGLIGILSARPGRMRIISQVGWSASAAKGKIPAESMTLRGNPLAQALREKRVVSGAMVQPGRGQDRRKTPPQRFLAAPLLAQEIPVGLLAVSRKSPHYSELEMSLLEAFALQAILRLENLCLQQALRHDRELPRENPPGTWEPLAWSIAHELRQPLSTIHHIVADWKTAVSSDDRAVRKNLKMLRQQTALAQEIVSNMIEFARSGKPKAVPTDLHAVLRSVLSRISLGRRICSKPNLARRLPRVVADPLHVERILSNLIANSLESMKGPGTLSITTQVEGDEVRLQITDTGCGIDPGQAETIFQPFSTTKGGGLGLGLALCRKLALANRGALGFRSSPGQGTTFELRLPRARAARRSASTRRGLGAFRTGADLPQIVKGINTRTMPIGP